MNRNKKNGDWLGTWIILLVLWALVSRWFGASPVSTTYSPDDAAWQRQEAIDRANRDYRHVESLMPGR